MQENTIPTAVKNTVIPDNIKQIGAIENDLRIYMEDYVYTYLCQYAKTGGNKEKLGVLVGRHIFNEGKNVLIISGFIQGKHTNSQRGSETFTNESWSYINEAKDTYFKDLEIVGWAHTQPGFGNFLMSKDEAYHNNFFPNDHQVLYVLDPSEKIDTFYIRNKESDRLSCAKGYFIYYDTNPAMQDYMIDNRLVKPKEPRLYPEEEKPKKSKWMSSFKKQPEPVVNSGDPAVIGRTKLKKRSHTETQKRKLAILGSVSALLCASCIMICLNVMNHSERIRNLEAELNSATFLSSQNTATVFASQPETSYEETEPTTSSSPQVSEEDNLEAIDPDINENSDIPEYYVVEKGDSLSYISRKFYGDDSMITAIMAENSIENSDRIFYGKKIKLPNP